MPPEDSAWLASGLGRPYSCQALSQVLPLHKLNLQDYPLRWILLLPHFIDKKVGLRKGEPLAHGHSVKPVGLGFEPWHLFTLTLWY